MDYTHLSKKIAYILRHAPWEYELELDEEGWVPLEQLLEGLRSQRAFRSVTADDIARLIRESSKTRYEIQGDRIRAYYGHSVPGRVKKERTEPPAVLYHGTVRRFLPAIREKGLQPMSRQYVHLSLDEATARVVANRRGSDIVLLRVRAADAHAAGVPFYRESDGIWLADPVPPEWIEFP